MAAICRSWQKVEKKRRAEKADEVDGEALHADEDRGDLLVLDVVNEIAGEEVALERRGHARQREVAVPALCHLFLLFGQIGWSSEVDNVLSH